MTSRERETPRPAPAGTSPDAPPVILLAGFMGTGKTIAGRALADLLGIDFVDTDEHIASAAGQSVSEIFERFGEAHFRRLEKDLCEELAGRRGVVIASGGGMLLDPEVFDHFERNSHMVLLEASTDVLCERLRGDQTRPLAGSGDDDGDAESLRRRIEQLLAERSAVYNRIGLRVDTSELPPAQVAATIAARLALPHVSMIVDPLAQKQTPIGRFGRSHVKIGRGVISHTGAYLREYGIGVHAFVCTPKHLEPLFLPQLDASLVEAGIPYTRIRVDDGDMNKTLEQTASLLDRLVESGAKRDSTVVTVGGGVTGDIAGFAAAIYMRGIALAHIPTTLLAQVDSSIGGKVGVNHTRAKNLIGSFYQPHVVLCDPCALRTLPGEEISNGMAEVVKSAWIGSPALFEYVESQRSGPSSDRIRDADFLERCVHESAYIKIHMVNADPYERGQRRWLNLGHTLGHALEATTGYRGITHGRAVALGLVAAIRIAVDRGVLDAHLLDRTRDVLEWCGLPTTFRGIDPDRIADTLWLDKKVRNGRIHFVLPVSLGKVEVVDDVSVEEILATVKEDR